MARPTKPPDPAKRPDYEAWWSEATGSLPTPNTILAAGRLRLQVTCKVCDRKAEADLPAIINRGRGDVPVRDLRFRCSACGSARTVTAIMQRR